VHRFHTAGGGTAIAVFHGCPGGLSPCRSPG
jgi:hypothetical protein